MYVRLLIEAALSRGVEVTLLVGRGGAASEEFATHIREIVDKIQLLEDTSISVSTLSATAREVGAGITVVPDGDSLVSEVALRGTWSGPGQLRLLIMRPSGQPSFIAAVQLGKTAVKALIRVLARSRPNVFVFKLRSSIGTSKSRYSVADPVTFAPSLARDDIRRSWPAPESRYWFGVIGALSARKNIPLICEALCSEFEREVGFVVAGRADDSLRDLDDYVASVEAAGVPVVRIDEVLTDANLDAVVAGVDCVVLAHSNEGSSGILGKALVAGTRLVMSGAKSLRRDAATLHAEAEWVPLELHSLRSALKRATEARRPNARELGSSAFADALLQ